MVWQRHRVRDWRSVPHPAGVTVLGWLPGLLVEVRDGVGVGREAVVVTDELREAGPRHDLATSSSTLTSKRSMARSWYPDASLRSV